MNKQWIRRTVIAAVFIVSFIFFSIYLNQGTTDMTVEMKEATLPVVSVSMGNHEINKMHGYTKKMEVSSIRDSITPIGEDREINIKIDKYGQDISEVSFEVRSVDGTRLIEDTDVMNFQESRDTITASVHLKDLIENNTEYSLIIILNFAGGREAYYYTRIFQCSNENTNEKIDFIQNFHNKTFDKEQAKELSKYLEPNSEGDNTDFGTVTIHSSLNQVSWGNLNVEEIMTPELTICEIGTQTMSATVDTIVRTKEGKITNDYRVKEYYRIRYTNNRTYLLDYERTMSEMFLMEKESFANNKIILGIQNEDVKILESDGGDILALENGGRVFSYNVTENEFAKLFSFYDSKNFDLRTYYDQSKVKILDVEENGNVSFMVYGYMNRGTHEGEVGIEICYYSSLLNTIEEQIFISYDKSQKILMQDLEKLSYVNKDGTLFLLLDGTIYQVDITEKTYTEVVSGLHEDSYQVSESGEMLVWQEENQPTQSKTLVLMNLNTGNTTQIKAKSGEYIRSLGFMNDDIIYGIAKGDEIVQNPLGEVIFPMNRIVIQSEIGEILKNYESDGTFYITDAVIENNQISLKRVKKTEDGMRYEMIEDDQITSNAQIAQGINHVSKVVTELYETIHQVELKNEINTKTLKFLTPKEVLFEGGRNITIEEKETANRLFVYAKGKIIGIFDNSAHAVQCAYDNAGTVTDCYGNEVYKRGELSTRNQIMAIKEESITEESSSLSVCLETMLKFEGISRNTDMLLQQGKDAGEILTDNLKDCHVLNLTGCNVDTILYYVNRDIPVLALLNDGSAVLVIGFNEQNTVLFDPVAGKIYKKGMNDSRELFEENGNHFMTYVYKTNQTE